MAKKQEPTYWSDADPSVWVTPETKAKYWAQLIGRVETVSDDKRTATVKFEYNMLGTRLEKPELMTFPTNRLKVVPDFFARVRRHVVHAPSPIQAEDYEEVAAKDTLLESEGLRGAKSVPDGRTFVCVIGNALFTQDHCFTAFKKPKKKVIYEKWLALEDGNTVADNVVLMHYNGVVYRYEDECEKPEPPAPPPAPAVATPLSRTIVERGLVVLKRVSEKRVIIGKPDKSHAEEWEVSDAPPATLHMIIDDRYWTLVKELKPSDPRLKS